MCYYNSPRGIKGGLCDFTGRGLLEAYSCFPLDFVPFAFPFADFGLCSFTVVNHTYAEFCVSS